MKISEMQKQLAFILKNLGDIEVRCTVSEYEGEEEPVSLENARVQYDKKTRAAYLKIGVI